jgi:hypothetical protein
MDSLARALGFRLRCTSRPHDINRTALFVDYRLRSASASKLARESDFDSTWRHQQFTSLQFISLRFSACSPIDMSRKNSSMKSSTPSRGIHTSGS